MPPLLITLIASSALAWWLIEEQYAIPVFLWIWALIILMFAWPWLSGWFFTISIILVIGAVLLAFWETVAGIVLGVITFFFLMLALLSVLAR